VYQADTFTSFVITPFVSDSMLLFPSWQFCRVAYLELVLLPRLFLSATIPPSPSQGKAKHFNLITSWRDL